MGSDGQHHFRGRARFAIRKNKINELFTRLGDVQIQLDSLISKFHKLPETQSKINSANAVAGQLLRYRLNAMHRILAKTLRCEQHPKHCVNLHVDSGREAHAEPGERRDTSNR